MAYETVTETAKKIRTALKAKFPGTKFSVRSESFSMGSAVRIGWSDGPTGKQVQAVVEAFEKIDRDATGEILSGGNRYITCNRTISERVRKYGTARACAISWSSKWDEERHAHDVMHRTEVRPDGQLLEWSAA